MEAAQFKIYMTQAYGPMMSRALAMLRDPQAAKDVVQEVCIHLWERPDGLASAASPTAYCVRAVHHSAISMLRRQHRFEPLENLQQEPVAEAADSEADYLHKLLAVLPAAQRRAFLLRQEQGLEYDEIAGQMQLKADNVRQLISRARKKLRELYERDN